MKGAPGKRTGEKALQLFGDFVFDFDLALLTVLLLMVAFRFGLVDSSLTQLFGERNSFLDMKQASRC